MCAPPARLASPAAAAHYLQASCPHRSSMHPPSSSATMSLHSFEQQGDIALKAHVASICFKCFRGMLQVFHACVAKVDWDVAMVVHICCKLLFLMFHLFFPDVCCKCVYLDVAYVSHICCKCFIWMLLCFTMVFKCFYVCFASVSYAWFKCFICLHKYVACVVSGYFEVDRVLHLPLAFCYLTLVSPPGWASVTPSPSFSMLVTFGATRDPHVEWREKRL
jgi:hypothetical protein